MQEVEAWKPKLVDESWRISRISTQSQASQVAQWWGIHLQGRRHKFNPGPGRSPGEGNGNPLQYSSPENSTDRGTWQATVHGGHRVGHDLLTKQQVLSLKVSFHKIVTSWFKRDKYLIIQMNKIFISHIFGLHLQFWLPTPQIFGISWAIRAVGWCLVFRQLLKTLWGKWLLDPTQEWASVARKTNHDIRGLELQYHPCLSGRGLQVEWITNGQWFNQSCLRKPPRNPTGEGLGSFWAGEHGKMCESGGTPYHTSCCISHLVVGSYPLIPFCSLVSKQVFLSSMSHSKNLIKPKEGSWEPLICSQLVRAQVKITWACDWHLRWRPVLWDEPDSISN